MNRAEILQPGTRLLRSGLPGVRFNVDPACQLAAARRLLAQSQRGEQHLVLRSHERDFSAKAVAIAASVVDPGAPIPVPRTKRSRDRQDRLLAIAGQHPAGISRLQLAGAVGVPGQNLSSPLRRLISTGQMRRSGPKGAYRAFSTRSALNSKV